MDYYGFYTGEEFSAYEYLGAHCNENGTVFRTFAPNAQHIAVIGEWNGWKETPMNKVYDGNFWECEIPDTKQGMMYKYRIYKRNGVVTDHCDPYGFYAEPPQRYLISVNLSSRIKNGCQKEATS